jgi:transposase
MTIEITCTDFTPAELRRRARRSRDANQSRRLLAMASILDGASRTEAARSAGMDRQSLRDWVHRYNAEGVEGLRDRPRTGRKPLLNQDQLAELDRIVQRQPDPAADGVVRWRCIDLKALISKRFGVELSERSVGRILTERGFRKLSARPRHPEADEASQQTSRTIFPMHYGTSCLSQPGSSLLRSGSRTRPASGKRAH